MTALATELTFRPATEADLPACAGVWRDALNEYMGRLNLPTIPDELGAIGRLHTHLRSTDPDRFWTARRPDGTLVGFAAAVVRQPVWFLSMLFVHPAEQARGIGRELLARVLPDPAEGLVLATATDSAQPISNALYSTYGIVPRMPLLSLVGRPERPDRLEPLPEGVSAVPFEEIAAEGPGGAGHRALADVVDALDRDLAGLAHPQDHRYLRMEGRRGFLYRGRDGRQLGYGYTSALGRMGPVAVRDEALLAPVLGHLLTAIEPRGASAIWVPGEADRAIVALLRAGLRFDGFPVLVCWSSPFADFGRYLPISPGLL